MTGLLANTTYYVKAYATNSAGTAYGNEISFSTLPDATVPSLVTTAISSITSASAVSGGTITNAGGVTITAKGVCWSTSSGPTIANSKTSNGSGTSGYASTISSLSPNTTYYVRAYATNSVGTGYGNELTFTTLCSSYATVNVSITVSANPVCAGSTVTFTATPTNGGTSPTYQWKVNAGNVTGATNATYSYAPINGDAVTCVLTSNAVCVSGNPATSNTISMTVNSEVSAGITIAASANPVCAGTSVTFTAIPVNGGSAPTYLWKVNGNNVPGATTATYSYTPSNNDAVSCTLTSNAFCVVGNPAVSNAVNLTITPNLPVSVSISASVNPVSPGSSVTFIAVPVNGGSSPLYQWKVNGVNVGTNTPAYSYVPANNDSINCVMISNLVCKTGSPATSNVVVMSINVMNIPCPGLSTVTYGDKTYNTLKIGNQCWLKENLNIGIRINDNQEAQNDGLIEKYCYSNLESNCDIYGGLYQWAEMMNYTTISGVQGICPMGFHIPTQSDWNILTNFLGGSQIAGGKMKEQGFNHWLNPNANATNESGFSALPAGFRFHFNTFTDINISNILWSSSEVSDLGSWAYKMEYNVGSLEQGNDDKGNGMSVRCLKDTCSSYSNTGVLINASANNICSGAPVTFAATPSNGGSSPYYQWKVNGIPAGTNSPTYTYSPGNNDAVTCVMTSNILCASNPATSNTLTMAVNPSTPVSVSILASGNNICPGTIVHFTASALNGGNAPIFQWRVNNVVVNGATDSVYAYSPLNNDTVKCMVISIGTCNSGSQAISNTITMMVINYTVSVSITASANPVNSGTSVTFTATPHFAGSPPAYQWKVNGVNAGTNSPTYTYSPNNNDSVICYMTTQQICHSGAPVASNVITMTVNNMGFPCPGTPTVNYGGQTYNTVKIGDQCWFRENLNIGARIDGVQEQTNNGIIEKYCYNNLESNCDIYGGLFQWDEAMQYFMTEGVQGICPSGWHFPTDNDWCVLTAFIDPTAQCNTTGWISSTSGGKMKETGLAHWDSPNTGASNISGFTTLPAGTRYVWDHNFYNLKTWATFWASASATTSSAYVRNLYNNYEGVYRTDYQKANGFSIRCIKDTCSTYSSTSIFITPSFNSLCYGNSVTLTAIATNGGISPFYQWKVNGTFVGTNSPTYSFTPTNGDSVRCIMTSSVACALNPATSNKVTMTVNVIPSSPTAGTHIPSQNQVQWVWNAVTGATGYKWSATNDYTAASDMGTALVKTESDLTCNTSYTRFVWAYNTCGNSTPVTLTQMTSACAFTCGSTITVNHIAGAVAPVTKTTTYGTVTNIPGEPTKCWITSNLGSDHQATAVNDATEASAGWYWQFNRKQGYKHDGTTRTPGSTWITSINENSAWLTANDPCNIELGTSWHLATYTEWYNVYNTGSWTTWTGSWNSGLKLHAAGYLSNGDGSLVNRGSGGYYWSSAFYDAINGKNLSFNSGFSSMSNISSKANGFSVRCVRDCSAPNAPTPGTHVPAGTQIIWNWNSVTGATGYKWNTTNDYSSATDMGAAITKTETGLICGTSYTRYIWAYNSCINSTPVQLNQVTLACPFVCGTTVLAINHVTTGGVAPVNKTTTYGTVNSIAGEQNKCWITSNLGSDHQATSVDDATEASAGWYWQFNRKQGYKHDGTSRAPNTTWITSIGESSDWITANDPCNSELGNIWHMPTYTEWYNVDNTGGWTDWNGPWNSGLKLHAAGYLGYNGGSLTNRGSYSHYWSSAEYDATFGWNLGFSSGSSYVSGSNKASGFTARCLRDN